MPLKLTAALPAAATLGPFIEARPTLIAMPGCMDIWDTDSTKIAVTGGKVTSWSGHKGALSFAQTDAALRPVVNADGWIDLTATAVLNLSGNVTSGAGITTAFRYKARRANDIIYAPMGGTTKWNLQVKSDNAALTATIYDAVSGLVTTARGASPGWCIVRANGTAVTVRTDAGTYTKTVGGSTHNPGKLILGSPNAIPSGDVAYAKAGIWASALSDANLDLIAKWLAA